MKKSPPSRSLSQNFFLSKDVRFSWRIKGNLLFPEKKAPFVKINISFYETVKVATSSPPVEEV